MESGKLKVEPKDVDFKKLVDQFLDEVQPIAEEKQLTVYSHFNREPFPRLVSDPRLIRLILNNLFTNAIKYTDRGGRVTLSCKAENGNLLIRIIDTGRGIAKNDLGRIFEPFEQVGAPKRRGGNLSGVGLGLTLVKHVVQALGGKIEVESDLGKGSTFTVTLPLLQAQPFRPAETTPRPADPI